MSENTNTIPGTLCYDCYAYQVNGTVPDGLTGIDFLQFSIDHHAAPRFFMSGAEHDYSSKRCSICHTISGGYRFDVEFWL